MAGKGAVLAIRIVSDASGGKRGLNETEKATASLSDKMDRASLVAGGVVAGLAAIGKEAYESASALQQSGGAVESVFGAQAAAIKGYAADAAQAVGLSTNSYQELASVLGAQLGGMGYAGQELTAQTDALIKTGADLAATFGGSTSDAVSALSSLMRGERDPIERYGIALNQAAVDARVAAMGLDTSTPAAERAANAQATLALVAEQSAAAQGAFAREADTAAGQTQRASAEFENAKAALGEALLPIVAEAAEKFAGLAGWVGQNKTAAGIFAAVVGGLALAILAVNAAVKAYRAIAVIATAVQWAWNVAMTANPIGLIVLAIAAVVAAVILMYNKFEWFRDLIGAIGDFFGWVWDKIKEGIAWVADKLEWLGDAASWVGDLFSASGTVTVTPVAGGSLAGMFGAATGAVAAAGGGAASAGLFGASLGALAGGRSSAGQGRAAGMVVNVNISGALDPVAVGRQLEKVLRDYGRATGRQVALTVGRS